MLPLSHIQQSFRVRSQVHVTLYKDLWHVHRGPQPGSLHQQAVESRRPRKKIQIRSEMPLPAASLSLRVLLSRRGSRAAPDKRRSRRISQAKQIAREPGRRILPVPAILLLALSGATQPCGSSRAAPACLSAPAAYACCLPRTASRRARGHGNHAASVQFARSQARSRDRAPRHHMRPAVLGRSAGPGRQAGNSTRPCPGGRWMVALWRRCSVAFGHVRAREGLIVPVRGSLLARCLYRPVASCVSLSRNSPPGVASRDWAAWPRPAPRTASE